MKSPPQPAIPSEMLDRLIKSAVGGANQTIELLNSTLPMMGAQIASQQALLTEANATIARLSSENAELRTASLERDTVLQRLNVELEKIRLADKRKGEMLGLAQKTVNGVLQHMAASGRALPPGPSQPQSEGLQGLSVKALGMRLFTSLRPETIAAIRQDSGDELVAALLRAFMAEDTQDDDALAGQQQGAQERRT